MTIHIVDPEVLKQWIDSMVTKGVKAFVISNQLHGVASLPSKRCPLYRIPLCIGEEVFNEQNLSKVMGGSRLILPIDDLNWLSENAITAMQKKKVGEK